MYFTYTVVVYRFVCCVYCFVNTVANSCYYATLATMPLLLLCHFTSVPMAGIISRFVCIRYEWFTE